jgi:hypothetical protein
VRPAGSARRRRSSVAVSCGSTCPRRLCRAPTLIATPRSTARRRRLAVAAPSSSMRAAALHPRRRVMSRPGAHVVSSSAGSAASRSRHTTQARSAVAATSASSGRARRGEAISSPAVAVWVSSRRRAQLAELRWRPRRSRPGPRRATATTSENSPDEA